MSLLINNVTYRHNMLTYEIESLPFAVECSSLTVLHMLCIPLQSLKYGAPLAVIGLAHFFFEHYVSL